MSSDAIMLNEILENLDEEDYRIAITFLQYLSDMKKKKRAEESNEILAQIQSLFSDDKGWDNEEQMLADMAAFRKRRMGL